MKSRGRIGIVVISYASSKMFATMMMGLAEKIIFRVLLDDGPELLKI